MAVSTFNPTKFIASYFFRYAVALLVGGIFGWWVGDNTFHVSPALVGTIIGALFGVLLDFLWNNRHLLVLADLRNISSLAELRHSKRVSKEATIALAETYKQLQGNLIRLLSAGYTEGNSYRDQIDLAYLLRSGHSTRFWATSLDRWSTFLQSNEAYIRQMMTDRAEHIGPISPLHEELSTKTEVPGHARVFILPVGDFVDDVIHSPTIARVLVKHHLQAWKVPLRLLLHGEESFGLTFKRRLEAAANGKPLPIIPDFMVVDSRFVYGRITPDRVETEPFRPPEIKLGYSSEPHTVKAYEVLFERLWTDSLEVRNYCWTLRSIKQEKRYPMAFSPVSRAASQTFDILERGNYSEGERERFFSALSSIEGDLNNFLNNEERAIRYTDISPNAEGPVLVDSFLGYLGTAKGAVFAIDKADVKQGEARFWETWNANPDYKKWNHGTQKAGSQLKQRIFVIKTWHGLEAFAATDFIGNQLKNNVTVGFILERDLDDLAAGKPDQSSDEGSLPENPTKAGVDSDFILVNLALFNGAWTVGDSTRGFEISYEKYRPQHASYSSSLLCREKMEGLLTWYRRVWEDGNTFKIESVNGMDKFLEHIRGKTASQQVA
jgi:hypothetical protein